ncbi:MAG: hypothetical protein V3T24_10680 [Longimicrobiales bacterium]
MKKMMMGWVVITLAVTAVLAAPSNGQSQSSRGTQRAAELESEASALHDQPQQWAYAADLYLAAVQLREDEDPQAQEDLLLAANLCYEAGETARAIAALEAAGSRALASGDFVRAADMFTDAAWVAQKEGLKTDQRRLTSQVTGLANSPEVTSAERREILSRFAGH